MNDIILYILMFFMVLGALDRLWGYRLGIGQKFEEGFMAMGNLALSIIGIYSIAPLISASLEKVVVPIFSLMGADPSIFPASILASDMGGYLAAMRMAQSYEIGLFSGLILASSLGATVIFTIPIGAGIIQREDYPYFTKGILAGLVTVPLSGLAGGLAMGLTIRVLIKNLLPIIFIAAFLSIGLLRWPQRMMRGFYWFSKSIVTLGTLGLVLSIIQGMTRKIFISNMESFEEGLKIVGSITMVLAGAYPMMFILTKFFQQPLHRLGKILGIGENATTGILMALANNIPTFAMMYDMDERGKVMVSAFAVGGAFMFGGQLGFVAGIEKAMLIPFMVSKVVGGIGSLLLAYLLTTKGQNNEIDQEENKVLQLNIGEKLL